MDEENQGGMIAATPAADEEPRQTQGAEADGAEKAERTFTQEEVNGIVRERLDRQHKSWLSDLGAQSQDELKGWGEKAKGYDEAVKKAGDLETENAELRADLLINKAGVRPEREDDVRTYFKGKGEELNEENLRKALETHPEWIGKADEGKAKPVAIGGEHQAKKAADPDEEAAKLFGLDRFVK